MLTDYSKLSKIGKKNNSKLIDYKAMKDYKSRLSITRPFASNEFAQRFCVCNPRKASKGDHTIYSVFGEDKIGRFEV